MVWVDSVKPSRPGQTESTRSNRVDPVKPSRPGQTWSTVSLLGQSMFRRLGESCCKSLKS
ncbi:hypothetical protein Hanom_Chr03g00196441 [Helianthus anomalus]